MLTTWTKLPLAKANYVTTDLGDSLNSFWGSPYLQPPQILLDLPPLLPSFPPGAVICPSLAFCCSLKPPSAACD